MCHAKSSEGKRVMYISSVILCKTAVVNKIGLTL